MNKAIIIAIVIVVVIIIIAVSIGIIFILRSNTNNTPTTVSPPTIYKSPYLTPVTPPSTGTTGTGTTGTGTTGTGTTGTTGTSTTGTTTGTTGTSTTGTAGTTGTSTTGTTGTGQQTTTTPSPTDISYLTQYGVYKLQVTNSSNTTYSLIVTGSPQNYSLGFYEVACKANDNQYKNGQCLWTITKKNKNTIVLANKYAKQYIGFMYGPDGSKPPVYKWYLIFNNDSNNTNKSNGDPYTRYTFYITDKNQIVNYDSNKMLYLTNDNKISYTTNYNDDTMISNFTLVPV
jgi:hypothetical protein